MTIAGEVRMEPGTREQFFEAVAPRVAATLREPGCRAYAFTPDPGDDDLIRLWELWDDDEALTGHFASNHMAEWQEHSRSLPVVGRNRQRHRHRGHTARLSRRISAGRRRAEPAGTG